MKAKITIDDYEQIIEYKSPESTRKGRVNNTELLGDGGQHFHVPGLSNDYTAKFTTYIQQDDVTQLEHFDNAVYKNEKVHLISTFNNIKSGYYYLEEFSPKYHDSIYYSVSWTCNLITDKDTLSDVYGSINDNNALSTSTSLKTDTTSFTNTIVTLTKSNTTKTQIKQIQRLLKTAGYYVNSGQSSLLVDGIWGSYTTSAIQKYQKAKGLTVTGTITTETKKSLGF